MKKTFFWKGLAFAAIALVCSFTTSCSEEELKINSGTIDIPEYPTVPELAAPIASVAVTVLDFENGEILSYEVTDISNYIGKEYTVKMTAIDGYTVANDININVPAIQQGQAIVIPVTFYVVPLNSAIKDIVEELGGNLPVDTEVAVEEIEEHEVTASGSLPIEDGVIINESEVAAEVEISIPYKSGYEYRNIESRSVATTLASLKAETKIYKMKITVLPNCAVTIETTQVKTPVVLTVDGVEYPLWFYGDLEVNVEQESLSHDAGHGHGNGSNAGGGVGEAE